MRCSSFEPLLDDFIDGKLPLETHARVAAHVESCASCNALLTELRVIDALLLQPRRLEPAANFAFAVMAEVRVLPLPHASRVPPLAVLSAYLAFAWSAIGLFFILGKSSASAALGFVTSALSGAAANFGALAESTSRMLSPQSFQLSAAMTTILGFDIVAVLLALVAFNLLRPRLAARRARMRAGHW